MNIHKDYKLLRPIRKWLVNKAFIRIILDKDKLTNDDVFILSNIIVSQMNKNSNDYKYSIEIHKVNNDDKEND